MTDRLTPVSRLELIKGLRRLGWDGPDSHSRHEYMRKTGHPPLTLPNPHRQNDVGVDLLRRILRQAGISREEWQNRR